MSAQLENKTIDVKKNTQTFDFTIGAGQCVAGKQVSTTEDTLHISLLR